MRTLLLVPVVLCSLHTQAKRLNARLMTSPGRVVIQQLCPDATGANTNSALTSNGTYSFITHVERHFPGTVSVSVSGGVPPYRYDWHGLMADVVAPELVGDGLASTCSVMPGMVRVTVSDAAGNSVTRTAQVGAVRSLLPAPCDNIRLIDPDEAMRSVPRIGNYYGSAKPRFRSTAPSQNQLIKPELRTGVKYIPPGPSQGGGQKPTKVSSGMLVR